MVVTVNEELHVSRQGVQASRKASRLTREPFQVMPQIGIDGFDRVGFLLVGSHFIGSAILQGVVDRKGIRVILLGLWSAFQAGLHGLRSSFQDHIPTQHAMRVSVYNRQNVDFVFFAPIKVYNSSNSAFLTLSGMGAFGSLVVY